MQQIIVEINNLLKEFQDKCHNYQSNISKGTKQLDQEGIKIFTKNIPELISSLISDSGFEVKGSIGIGRIASCPWITILNKKVAKNTKAGVYLGFLLSKDLQKIYLTLNQGVETLKRKEIPIQRDQIRSILQLETDILEHNNSFDIDNKEYQQAAIYATEWKVNDTSLCITQFQTFMNAYQQYINTTSSTSESSCELNSEAMREDTKNTQQIIYFGSPGTGKSHNIKALLRKEGIIEDPKEGEESYGVDRLFRTTFHPDTDYASFVGCYKPVCDNDSIKKLDFDKLYAEAQLTKVEIDKNSRNKVEILCQFADKYAESLLNLENSGMKWTTLLDQLFGEQYVNSQTYIHSFCKIIASMRKNAESKIQYKFVPQVFTEAYVKAWDVLDKNEQVFLVIEEINRGNCAQIFGDLFQLLDRKENGYSEYKVKADIDLAKYLKEVLEEKHPDIAEGNLCLPPNLNILATMNTSDQSLFPMDSAFKRRWDWKYVPTKVVPGPSSDATKAEVDTIISIQDNDSKKDNILINYDFKNRVIDFGQHDYKWSDFLKAINERIKKVTYSDDKLLGYWFVKGDKDGKVSISTFVSKVIFYLWNDVFKEYGAKPLNPFCIKNKENQPAVMSFNQFFDDMSGEENIGVVHTFMGNLGLIPDINKEVQEHQDNQQLTEGTPSFVEEEN